MNTPVLIVLTGKHKGKRLRITETETVIGRDEVAKIRIATSEVSRQHTLLILEERGLLVRDLGSRNGTFVNGMPLLDEVILQPGDTLAVGPMTFQLEGGSLQKKRTGDALLSQGKSAADDTKTSDAEIASWLTDEIAEGLSTSDTTILSNKKASSPSPIEKPKAPKPIKREFKSVAEEAADIIRRHLESLDHK